MSTPLAEQVIERVHQARDLYYRLVLVVGPSRAGKTETLRQVEQQLKGRFVNAGLELSQRLLDVPERQRPVRVAALLGDVLGEDDGRIVLLDDTELLFEVSLRQDPLRLLQHASRNRTVVASWHGMVQNGSLTHAVPGHPEFRRWPIGGLLLVTRPGSEPRA